MNDLRTWASRRPEPSGSLGTWLGLFIGFLLVVQTGAPTPAVLTCMFALAATLLVSLRWRIGGVAVLVLLLVGAVLRHDVIGHPGSDVLTVTRAAIEQALGGGNPYGHGFPQSTPPGSPFAYGPLALLWYLPQRSDPRQVELFVSSLVLLVLAVRGRVLGLAIYATLPLLVITTSDGSNDTSAGLLILVALLVAERAPLVGAALLALAAAFKPYAVAWLFPLAAYGGLLTLLVFGVASVVLWGPALVWWGPGSILTSFRLADASQYRLFYSLAVALRNPFGLPKTFWEILRVGLAILIAISSWVLVRSARSLVVVGIAVFLAALYLGWWGTYAYLAAIAPLVCWHLDDWLGIAHVIWPGDPVGALTDRADARWPIWRPWASQADTDVSSAA